MGASLTPRRMAKELLSGNVPPRPLFLPIAFSLGARVENVPLRTFLSNPVKICNSARQIRSHLRADGAACYFDPLLEVEALGATLVWETENGRAALHWSGHSGKGELPQGLRSPEDAVKSGGVPVATEVIRRLNATPQREFLLMAGVSGPFRLAARLTQLSHQDSAIGKDLPQDALELSAVVITQVTSAFVEAGADVIFILEDVLPALDAEGCAAWASLLAPTINVVRFYEALPVLVLTNEQSFVTNSGLIAGSVAQTSFDAYVLPRHIGLYSGVPIESPALLVQRVCGTGMEAISQAADNITLEKFDLALCVGAESMSRNPVAAYTHRGGFRMGQVEFKDFLWEALLDTAPGVTMGETAEMAAKIYKITREDADRFAESSFSRAVAAQKSCFLSGEIVPLVSEIFDLPGYKSRGIQLPKGTEPLLADTHIRPSSYEALSKIRPAFGGVQTGGNSSAIVDGAAAALVSSGAYMRSKGIQPLARVAAVATVGVPPEHMIMGPMAAIQKVLEGAGLSLDQIDRFEINEAFAAQVIAAERELQLDRNKLNVNGGAIAIGHPLAATGVRLAITLARELRRSDLRYGVSSACIGGGQGIAVLLERVS